MKIEFLVPQTVVVDGKLTDCAIGDKVDIDDPTGKSLVQGGAAKNLGGRPKKQAVEAPTGVTTENVISSD